MSDLTAIKERLNSIGSQRNSLQIRRNIIQESIAGFNDQKFEYDLAQLQLIYQQASSLIPTLQHTFEEMVEYHNRMLANRIVFIESEIPNIEKQILALTKQFEELRLQEVALTEKITTSDTFEELENIILALNKQYTLKGQYSSIIEQIEEVEKDLKKYQQELSQIDDGLFADDFQSRVDSQLSKFNAIFAEISDELYDERYAVKADVVTNRKGQRNYKFSVMETNLSSGKKQGEISCFDIHL